VQESGEGNEVYEGYGNGVRTEGNGMIMFKGLPDELTLTYVFKDSITARS